MAEDNMTLGYLMGQESGNSGDNMFGGNGIWGLLALALVFGGLNGNGGGGIFGGGGGQNLTRAELYDGFAIQNIDSAVRGVQNGISDSTYALTGTITNGFHGVDNAICNLGYNLQSGLNGISREIGDCCCQTGRAIDGVNYNMATGFCNLGNTIQSGFRDIMENQNAGTREILNFLTQDKIATLTAENQSLKFAASQASQNAFITANQEAQTAELIRRLGRDCPVPAYWVSPPTPVPVPTNTCGCGCGC